MNDWLKKCLFVKIEKNGKRPVEATWPQQVHDCTEARKWANEGYNVGILCSSRSGVLIVDIDRSVDFMKQFKCEMTDFPVTAKTPHGWHLFFKHEPGLRNLQANVLKWGELLYDNRQALIVPSVIDGIKYEFRRSSNTLPLLKDFPLLYSFIKSINTPPQTFGKNNLLNQSSPREYFVEGGVYNRVQSSSNLRKLLDLSEGNRHYCLTHLAGKFVKIFTLDETKELIDYINSTSENPISEKEIDHLLNYSVERFADHDSLYMREEIRKILVDAPEGMHWKEIATEIRGQYGVVRSMLSKMVINEEVKRLKRGWYSLYNYPEVMSIQDVVDEGEVSYKILYFSDRAILRNGDIIVIGAKTGVGKTHIGLNIATDLIRQKQKVLYQYTEAGARMKAIAKRLDCMDLKVAFLENPSNVTLAKSYINIIDWLMPSEYCDVDKIFKDIVNQAHNMTGIVIVFMQLKESGTWLAENLVKQFPAVAARYLYEKDKDGEELRDRGYFRFDKIREAHGKGYKKLKCAYNYETKILEPIEGE